MSLATVRAASIRLAQVSAIAISLAGATTFGGLQVLYAWNPELAETLPVTSTFARASVMEVLTTTDGSTNWYQETKSGEVPLDGLRRVENELSDDRIDGFSVSNLATINGDDFTFTASSSDFIFEQVGGIKKNEAKGFLVELTSNITGTVKFQLVGVSGAGGFVEQDIELTTTPTLYWVIYQEDGTGDGGVQYRIRNDAVTPIAVTITVSQSMACSIQDSSANPEEFTQKTVTYNAEVAGVQYLATVNGDTADGNGVVTKATGATITGGGCLPEPAATNQNQVSDLSSGDWNQGNVSVTDEGINSLGLNEYEITVDAVSDTHSMFDVMAAGGAGSAYIIAKQGTGRYIILRRGPDNLTDYAVYDLQAGTVTEEGSGIDEAIITSLGDDWYKCELNTSDTSAVVLIATSDVAVPGTAIPSYGGASETYLVCHVQYETTVFSTSPIITSGSTVTRVANTLTTGVNASASTSFLVDATAPDVAGSTAPSLAAVDGSSDDRVAFINDTSIISEADVQATITNDIRGERHKIAASWEEVAGGLIVVDDESNSATGTPTAAPWDGADMTLGYGGATQYWRGRIHNFVQYDASQTEAQLLALAA